MANFAKVSNGGGQYFKPADYTDALLLIEVDAFESQRPHPQGPQDTAFAYVTVFDGKGKAEELGRQMFTQSLLARDLGDQVGNAVVVNVEKKTFNSGKSGWVFNDAEDDDYERVVEYVEQREAALEAAMDDAPDFEDD